MVKMDKAGLANNKYTPEVKRLMKKRDIAFLSRDKQGRPNYKEISKISKELQEAVIKERKLFLKDTLDQRKKEKRKKGKLDKTFGDFGIVIFDNTKPNKRFRR